MFSQLLCASNARIQRFFVDLSWHRLTSRRCSARVLRYMVHVSNASQPYRAARPVDKPVVASSAALNAALHCCDDACVPAGGAAGAPCAAAEAAAAAVTCESLLPSPADALYLSSVLSSAECASLRAAASALNRYSAWSDADGARSFRGADTVEVDCPQVAAALWARMSPHLPHVVTISETDPDAERGTHGVWRATGLNENFLFSVYTSGGHFAPHTDGATMVSYNARSLYSVIIYLEECEDGSGGTAIFARREEGDRHDQGGAPQVARVYEADAARRLRWAERPCAVAHSRHGSALVFRQDLAHEGEPVLAAGATKTIIRTDVMFERAPARCGGGDGDAAWRAWKEAQAAEDAGDAAQAVAHYRRAARLCPQMAREAGFA